MTRTAAPMLDATTPVACCAQLSASDLTDEEAAATARLFKALGDPNRVRIVNTLATSAEPMCLCDINEGLDVTQPTVSFHLKKLVETGLVRRQQRGVWAHYSIDDVAAGRLRNVLNLEGRHR